VAQLAGTPIALGLVASVTALQRAQLANRRVQIGAELTRRRAALTRHR
jgi:hypothetical protein